MIEKLRELYDDWIKDKRKNVGDPLYAYEVYEFLDYCERKWDGDAE